MVTLPGYKVIKEIYSGNRRTYYQGDRESDAALVFIKTPHQGGTPKDLIRLQREYELLKDLKYEGILKTISLETYPGGVALIFEHVDGMPLAEYLDTRKIDLSSFLKIAVSITDAIGEMHRNHIIHKDIQPENIFINTHTLQISFVDFRFATLLPKENPKSTNPLAIEGSLGYISPEQTGRMNRTVDYRTDFYSLGILLYQLLTGRLPFEGSDPLKLVHSHLAKQPISPHKIDAEIPEVISEIIMKLLSKDAEERYLSAKGLIEDLKTCRQELEAGRNLELFDLGENDASEQLHISQKIYGREKETEILLELFEKARIGSVELAVISGNPGIGKTTLVQEVQIPITRENAFFISGKFDPFYKNVPYSAFINALQGLVKQLLTESEEELHQWKQRLMSVVGDYGQLFINAIPELELIIGKQPPVKQMESNEYINLVNRLAMDFINVFPSPEHPLVIFLDDLQWVDTSTLRLIEDMVTEAMMQNVFLILSYRDNEVDSSHPLMAKMESLKEKQFEFRRIVLNPLKLEDIAALTSDTLNVVRRSVAGLAELILQKTDGNPFFISQFLRTLYQEDLLAVNADSGFWEWDLQAITKLDFTDNVVELLVQRLGRMPDDTRHIMMMAACIGSRFDLKTLRKVTDYNDSDIVRHLLLPIRQDLLITSFESEVDIQSRIPLTFIFRHDRIRQASYSLISDENRKSTHKKIGQLLLDNIDSLQKDEEIFDIIHHLNIGADLIESQQECDEIAELNLIAGNRSMAYAAFEPAFAYFKAGIELLDEKSWQRQYHLSLELYSKCVETARLCGNIETMEQLFGVVVKNARTHIDCAGAYQGRIMSLVSENRRFEAIDMTLNILKNFDIFIPVEPTIEDMQSTINETLIELSKHNIEDLIDLPAMKDPDKLTAMKLIGTIIGATYQVRMELLTILICQGVKLSVRHGNISNSALSYCAFGAILCGYVGDIDTGYRFGSLGLDLIKRFDAKGLKTRTEFAFYLGVHHWKFHLRETVEPLFSTYASGVETGDYEFASYSILFSGSHALLAGKPLVEVEKNLFHARQVAHQLKQFQFLPYNVFLHQTALNLIEKKDASFDLMDDDQVERSSILTPQESGDKLIVFIYHFCKMMLCYFFGLHKDAVEHADHAAKLLQLAMGMATPTASLFFDSLSRLAVYETSSSEKQRQLHSTVKTNQSKMKKWMAFAPMNYAHKFYLVEAELARVLGKDDAAMTNYDLAIKHSRKNSFLNDEAISYELAAKFMMARNQQEFAECFMQKAYACYVRWGAARKADHLIEQYPQLTKDIRTENNLSIHKSQEQQDRLEYSQDRLDLATLLKSSQAIFSEIVLENLLTTMMRIVIENAGAEKGFLILNLEGRLKVCARGHVDSEKISVQSCEPVDMEAEALSSAVLRYVARTGEYVVIHNALADERFNQDPYFRKHHRESVLCIPIIYKSNLTGIIYLENRMIPDVFSADRVELLKLLTSQIAISIENTRLFERLKKAEEEYRGIFENAVEGIFLLTIDGQIISANPAVAQILGYDSPEELIEKISDIPNQLYASPAALEKFLRMVRKKEKIENFETQFRRKDGSLIWVSLNARSIFDENGKVSLLEGFIVDITERKAAADALQQREESLRKENIRLRADIKDRYKFGSIIGKSSAMQEVYELILKAAATNAAVIIYGESGTGKELVAKAVHEASDRKNGNFVPVNCGAIPDNLLESEFFGYKKGAFTGAHANKNGYLDQAHEGTLFLDELGEINLAFQVKLLRVLEDGSYKPLGDQTVKTSDARVVAATSRDLQKAIRDGSMREDFFYRIHVIPIHLPPLRKRQEDFPLLIEHFLKIHSGDKNAEPVSGKIIEALRAHNWPGNVRELQNVLQRYCTLGTLDFLSNSSNVSDPDESVLLKDSERNFTSDSWTTATGMEKKMIVEALEQNKWNRQRAARQLDINIRTFYRKLKKYNIIQA